MQTSLQLTGSASDKTGALDISRKPILQLTGSPAAFHKINSFCYDK